MRLPEHKVLHHHFLFKLRKIVMFCLCSVLICGCADSEKALKEERAPLSLLFHYSGFCLRGEGMGAYIFCLHNFLFRYFPFLLCYEYGCSTLMKNRYPLLLFSTFVSFSPHVMDATQKLMPFKIDLRWNFHQHSWLN